METQTIHAPVTLPPMDSLTPQQAAIKSKTHWVWTCYKDINNMGPFGIESQLGYRDHRWTEFKRCTPYPLGNLISFEADRELAAQNAGFLTEDIPKKEHVKYALDQALELLERHRDSGLRILTPLTGMDDPELVNQIIQVVQPFSYAIHEMRYEFTEGAEKRIRESYLSEEDQKKARELAKVMLSGAVDPAGSAEVKALAEYEALISSMSDKSVGQPGISNPNKFHEWICVQLGKDVPKRIDRTSSPQAVAGTDPVVMQTLLKQQEAIGELREKVKRPNALVKRKHRAVPKPPAPVVHVPEVPAEG